MDFVFILHVLGNGGLRSRHECEVAKLLDSSFFSMECCCLCLSRGLSCLAWSCKPSGAPVQTSGLQLGALEPAPCRCGLGVKDVGRQTLGLPSVAAWVVWLQT